MAVGNWAVRALYLNIEILPLFWLGQLEGRIMFKGGLTQRNERIPHYLKY